MLDTKDALLLVAVVAAVTFLTRAAPFWFFSEKRQTPRFVSYLGAALPPAIMAMLVVYCLKDATPLSYPFALPHLAACAVVVALHVWKKNTMLSIVGGTAVYMVLTHFL